MTVKKRDDTDLIESLRRLVEIAHGDTGQSRTVANFLLSWWNAAACGGFDFTDLWSLDAKITRDVLNVILLIAKRCDYPDAYGLRADFERLVTEWRPELVKH